MLFEKILLKFWEITKNKDNKRLALQSPPEGIDMIKDIPYSKGGKANLLDIYHKKGKKSPCPVIIMVHGGGWMYGDKELNQIYAMNLALRDFAIVNINYHLIQQKRFPQQIKDIYEVFNWIYDNANDYNLDINNVFITGDSAGAHLSSIALALKSNDKLRKELGVDTKLTVKAGGMICGAFELDSFRGLKKTVASRYAKVLIGMDVDKSPYAKLISTIKSINEKMPPLYLMTSKHDFLKEQTFHFVEYLKKIILNTNLDIGMNPVTKNLYMYSMCATP